MSKSISSTRYLNKAKENKRKIPKPQVILRESVDYKPIFNLLQSIMKITSIAYKPPSNP